jgi:hypothetical protein
MSSIRIRASRRSETEASEPGQTSGAPTASSTAERMRLTAVMTLLGGLMQLPLAVLHPHHEQPNDSPAAFAEYARSTDWVWVHLGQYLGTLLLALGLVTLALSLSRQRGVTGQLGRLAVVATVITAAVFAVQMAVDGIALKAAVDNWAAASGADQVAAYDVADAIRATEKGLSALFHLNNAVTLLALGVAMMCGRAHRILGCTGAAAGAGFFVVGALTARTGFSPEAAGVAVAPTLLLLIFLLGTARAMWIGDFSTSSASSVGH